MNVDIAQFLVSGVTSGSIYGLIALGFSLVQNTTGLVNFAQGEFVMLGGLLSAVISQKTGLPLAACFALAVIITCGVGVFMERGPLNSSRSREVLILVMITIGFSIFIKGSAMVVLGKRSVALPPFTGEKPFHILGASINPQALWVLGITGLVVGLLTLFFTKTLTGKAMRAVAENPLGARLVGIPERRVVMLSFLLAAFLGAVAGIIVTPITTISFDAGVMLGLKGFAAAVLGGYGHLPGSMVGGLLLGVFESLAAGYISSAYKDAFAFVILLFMLFFRSGGLFGRTDLRRA